MDLASSRAALFASGSHALAALIAWGAERAGWRRAWLPSYYCPEVPAALRATIATGVARGVELLAYPDASLWTAPDLASIPAARGDVVVVANQLGVRPRPDIAAAQARGLVVIEDHSHDPWSSWATESQADYAFASLRKTLPIPDGGAVWSPLGLELPPEPEAASAPSADRIAAALAGRGLRSPTRSDDDRLRFRSLARVAASAGGGPTAEGISPVSRALLPLMPIDAWREQRRTNLAILAEAATSALASGARLLEAPPGGVAFALSLEFATHEDREAARRALVARAVVPAILWPLDPARDWGAGPADAALSERILSIHGDQRFSPDDMQSLARLLREAFRA